LLTVQPLPRGADVAVHVIKKLKIKINSGNYFLNLKYLKINLKIIKNFWKNLKILFRKKKSEKKTLEIKIFENLIFWQKKLLKLKILKKKCEN